MACLNNLGEIASELGDYQKAKTYFVEAINIAEKNQMTPMLLNILGNFSKLYFSQGEINLAAELLALVINHPVTDQEIREKAAQRRAQWVPKPPDISPRQLEIVVKEILM